ncbi:MAG TPA: hypothetical protein VMF29_00880, partial [Candidatus Edwardsbacteria bacterium]|nr:hypothetical protein [Candidatus Edwardsbacteria bacterium]
RHHWTFMPYWGFKAREFSFSFDYQTPLTGLPMPPRAYLSLGKAFDIEWARIGARRSWGQSLMDPSDRFDLNLEYRRVRQVERFWDPRDIERGRTFILTAERGFAATSYRVASQFRAAASAGLITEPAIDINNFIRAEAEENATLRLARWLRPRVRAFAGYIAGTAPAQEQYFLSGGFKTTGFEDLIISYKGWWSAQERYHVDGGANLPGYLGRHARGNTVAALNVDLPLYRSPLSLFAGAGQVAGGWSALTANDILTDAGITLHLPFLRLLMPLWINRPLPGKRRFDWRWQISVGGSIAI